MNQKKENEVTRFHRLIVDLIKKYQFRDRNEICCFGISVSQCYILEALNTHGAMTMNELAKKMYLKISTVTRVVEQLVMKGLVSREEDSNDRRVRFIQLTKPGKDLFQKAWSSVFKSEKMIFESIPEEQRKAVFSFLNQLNEAVENWRSCCIK